MAGRANERFEGLHVAAHAPGALAREVSAGLLARPQPLLPAKLLYDEAGCELFDRICRTPEYYPTRTELALLERVAADVARRTRAAELVELGSGLARKTHVLLDALGANDRPLRWVPFDVSPGAVRHSADRLLSRYPRLRVAGVVGDFTRDLHLVPPGRERLVAFLGGTIGNFEEPEALAFVRAVRTLLRPGDHFLLAADLVKDRAVLHAAYNDAEGVTAAFSLNVLRRLAREFGAALEPSRFRHDAFFDEATSRIEIHARATAATRLDAPSLGVSLALACGASIRTEISRKFTPEALSRLLEESGFELVELYLAPVPYALVLARPV